MTQRRSKASREVPVVIHSPSSSNSRAVAEATSSKEASQVVEVVATSSTSAMDISDRAFHLTLLFLLYYTYFLSFSFLDLKITGFPLFSDSCVDIPSRLYLSAYTDRWRLTKYTVIFRNAKIYCILVLYTVHRENGLSLISLVHPDNVSLIQANFWSPEV